jgi:hypothetical protein
VILSVIFIVGAARKWGSPLLPDSNWKPDNPHQPLLKILGVLSIGVGLPYFLLATTSPILQSWFKIFRPGQEPYQLYAYSNLGSLLGLLSFPFLFEPLFGLAVQSWIWSGFYLVYSCLSLYLGLKLFRNYAPNSKVAISNESFFLRERRMLTKKFEKFLWVALPACSSILLLAVTNQITQDIAAVPFLWVLPLSVYLFSFMMAFSGEKWYPQILLIGALAITTLGVAYRLNVLKSTNMFAQLSTFILFLLIACWVCHGELYRIRPESNRLTVFYLYIALGSVIGAVFVNLVAPFIFNGFWELHWGILFCWILVGLLQLTNRPSVLDHRWIGEGFLIVLVVLGLSTYLFVRQVNVSLQNVVALQRNFYGVLRVRYFDRGEPPAPVYDLKHGSTSHGFQYRDAEKRTIPTSYYGRKSGVGFAIKNFRSEIARGQPLKIGLVGLGPGTLAAYGEKGDQFYFYEINPDIIDIASENAGYFTFLSDSEAEIEIIPGDARISLESEWKRGNAPKFDLLVLDAFSSDSIPTHLLTVEAVDLYLQHLAPKGVIAIHISNRYLNLAPPIRKLADNFDLHNALISNVSDDSVGSYAASWMLLSRNGGFFQIPEIAENMVISAEKDPDLRIWTDDYINLLPLIKEDVFAEIQ